MILSMNNQDIKTLKFSINGWTHLYSLQQAIQFNEQKTGRTLSINGRVVGNEFLNQQDTDISIKFIQTDDTPVYSSLGGLFKLAELQLENRNLNTEIKVDRQVFEELRKNLMEYGDIDGIHIIVTLGVLSNENNWHEGTSLNLVQLDYAMKGDA